MYISSILYQKVLDFNTIFLENAGKCQKIESEIKWPPCIIKLQEDVIAKLDETTKYEIDIELIGETVEKYIIDKELVSN